MNEDNFSKYLVRNKLKGRKLTKKDQIRNSILKNNFSPKKKRIFQAESKFNIRKIKQGFQLNIINKRTNDLLSIDKQIIPTFTNSPDLTKLRPKSMSLQMKRTDYLRRVAKQHEIQQIDNLISYMSTNRQQSIKSKQKYEQTTKNKLTNTFLKSMKRGLKKSQKKNLSICYTPHQFQIPIEYIQKLKNTNQLVKKASKMDISPEFNQSDSFLNKINLNSINYTVPVIMTSYRNKKFNDRNISHIRKFSAR